MSLIKQLEERRQELVREHELNIAAIDRLIDLERGKAQPNLLQITQPRPTSEVRQRGLRPGSLSGQVLSIMKTESGREWTMREIFEAIQDKAKTSEDGYKLPKDSLKARNALSNVLGDLWRYGRVVQVEPPRGRVPAVYRLVQAVYGLHEKEVSEETS